ncbi:Nodulin MtN21 /EamA-like transporter family protein, putative [Theobroma cacao]|uniref:Nodulin MtN21 /EamA-like transporter family protein, putative n=1 Tax=Theobroma cacao TaxID=3641 RepID=A0A061FU24_THECC|nr:Nodulin MtN21 /EamA-like transporter family protein, putative [Theobroma cacao]
MEASASMYNKAMPYLAMVFMRFGSAGMPIVAKFALNRGMSQHVLVVYRFAIATLVFAPFAIVFDRKVRPKMTFSVFVQILLLGLLEPTIDQNLYYTGIKYTTATVATALCNVLPAFVFLLAWACRLEKVDMRKLHCQAKILGTLGTVGGAMIMTLVNGPILPLPWTKVKNEHQSTVSATKDDPLKGALMILAGCVCWACFVILQAITLKSYPAELSLTTLVCFMGAIEGTIVALVMEGGNAAAWSIHWDSKLFAAAYSGVICSGVAYYVGAMVIQAKGPVFFAAFNPLTMVIVAIMSSFIFSEIMYLGRVIGVIVIVVGLYLVLWGKSKDQHSSDSDSNKAAAAPRSGEQMATIGNETAAVTSNQDFVLLDGVVCSGVAYYLQAVIMKARGPVFVTAFNPLTMVIVAILGSFVLSEVLYLGRVIGAILIVTGLYLV